MREVAGLFEPSLGLLRNDGVVVPEVDGALIVNVWVRPRISCMCPSNQTPTHNQ